MLNTSSRRFKRYELSPETLLNVLTTGTIVGIQQGILPGSRFRGFYPCERTNSIMMFVEHPMFKSVGEREEIPFGEPIVVSMVDHAFEI